MGYLIKRKQSPYWTAVFSGANGKLAYKSTKTTDKRQAQKLLDEWSKRAQDIREGLVDPAQERRAKLSRSDAATHVADWIASLKALGRSKQHVHESKFQVETILAVGKIETLADLRPSNVDRALAAMKADGRAPRTVNKARGAIKQFSRWLVADGRIVADELGSVRAENQRVDRRVVRRALTPKEVERLLAAAEASDVVWRGLTGHDRAMAYRLALGAGLRAGEVATVRPIDFDLGDNPTILIAPDAEKARRGAELPITRKLADLLKTWTSGKPEREPVVKVNRFSNRSAVMMRIDLAAAKIPFEDEDKRRVDFYALRHTYGTALARSGTMPAALAKLMRHSSIELAMRYYVHLGVENLRRDIDKAFGESAQQNDMSLRTTSGKTGPQRDAKKGRTA